MELSVVPYNKNKSNNESEDGDIVEEPNRRLGSSNDKSFGGKNDVVIRYRECMRNHAASLGGHASDGCGEFMASSCLSCAACGCHRNFHRREVIFRSPESTPERDESPVAAAASSGKRFRTKFTAEQKERMSEFADSIGWRFQRQHDSAINRFCSDIGVRRNVLKVWMHNNKNAHRRRESHPHPHPPTTNNNNNNPNFTPTTTNDPPPTTPHSYHHHHRNPVVGV